MSCGQASLPGQRMGGIVALKHLAPGLTPRGAGGERDTHDVCRGTSQVQGSCRWPWAHHPKWAGLWTQADGWGEGGRLLSSILQARMRSLGESLHWKGPPPARPVWSLEQERWGWRGGLVLF